MDANGTRFQLLLGRDDWSRCLVDGGAALGVLAKAAANREGLPPSLLYDEAAEHLSLAPRLFRFRAAATDRSVDPADRRGAARDRFGNLYWIDADERVIRVLSSGTGNSTVFWSLGGGAIRSQGETRRRGGFESLEAAAEGGGVGHGEQARRLKGLAVTEHHYLVVGVPDMRGLMVFDLYAGGPPLCLRWPRGVSFTPFDMSAAADGGVWVLDRSARRVWRFDRHFGVVDPAATPGAPALPEPEGVPEEFQPADDSGVRRAAPRMDPRPFSLDGLTPAPTDPVSVDVLPDGSILVLDRDPAARFSRVYRIENGAQAGAVVPLDAIANLVDPADRVDFRLTAHDMAFVPAAGAEAPQSSGGRRVLGTLYVVAADGNQSFAFTVIVDGAGQLLLEPLPRYLPMRLFGGKGLIAGGGRAYYDTSSPGGVAWVPLVEQKRPRFVASAVLETPAVREEVRPGRRAVGFFDGREPGCTWHRLMLDACIPAGARVDVFSRAADEPGDLAKARWQAEPPLYLRRTGSELPFAPGATQPAGGARVRGTWELLLQNARGRYLQLRLEISGDGRDTPRLRALRVYAPRFSYAKQYLPAVYQDDASSFSFVERFLANFEGIYTGIEDRVTAARMLMDWRSVPAEALPWLIGWFGLAADRAWGERSRRLLVKHAMTFFQSRGTIRGLRMALELAAGECPDESVFTARPSAETERRGAVRIVERFRTRRTPAVVFGDPTQAVSIAGPAAGAAWRPSQGGAELGRRYAAATGQPAGTAYPLRDPGGGAASAGWQAFSRANLGFVPSAGDEDQPAWAAFLRRRHRTAEALTAAYGALWTDFAEVPVPRELPRDGAPLADWVAFEGVVLPTRAAAHRFTVMLPVPRNSLFDLDERARRMGLARRIVELEKPAHTTFDVRFFYAMFRVGEARLGIDTLIELGSRAPELMPPMVLGRGFLSEGVLTASPPQDAGDRQVLGRDVLGGRSLRRGAKT